ncbi:MAG: radical SAM family heme chaperone HemW [Syntrophomonadaceae bacterium]|nr:radical SAM family heme chaperone HemW [Syntrophomonadaceae bacterium]
MFPSNALAVYVHIPFCRQKCLYCDFYSLPLSSLKDRKMGGVEVKDYTTAVLKELATYLNFFHRSGAKNLLRLSSLYVGGGTPTSLPVEQLSALIIGCLHKFAGVKEGISKLDNGIEVTVEANPETIDERYLTQLRKSGVNRLSLGVQSLDEGLLPALGRRHTVVDSLRAVKQARQTGFQNINLDLIYGLPGQSLKSWQTTLEGVLELYPEHISGYCLKIEPDTPFYQLFCQGALALPEEDEEVAMFECLVDRLHRAGYRHYEIANFARPGYESVHNQVYWKNQEYLGLGPSAHSCLRGVLPSQVWKASANRESGLEERELRSSPVRFANYPDLTRYQRHLESGHSPVEFAEVIKPELERAETLFLGLRLREGVSKSAFQQRFGLTLDQAYPGVRTQLIQRGLLQEEGERITLTSRALFVANEVFREFLP